MSDANDVPVEVVLAAFNDENGAEKALMNSSRRRKIGRSSSATPPSSGKTIAASSTSRRLRICAVARAWLIGGVIGGVVGLIFPPSILVSAAVGAAVGGLSARLHDAGFPDDRLREVGEGLKPNTSALIAVIEQFGCVRMEEELRAVWRGRRHRGGASGHRRATRGGGRCRRPEAVTHSDD